MPAQVEKQSVEEYMIKRLVEKGWKYVPGRELDRESYEDPLLINNLIEAIRRINKRVDLEEEDIKKILNELRLRSGQEGQRQILNFFKKGISIKLEKSKDLVRVYLFDFDNINNNEFIVSNQVCFSSATEEIIADIVLYINGIPLVIIECKNPGDISVSWEDAFSQIKEYEKKIPELFKYVQIGVAAELIAKYFPIVTWQDKDEVKIYEWKEKGKEEFGKDISMTSIIEMLSRENLLNILRDYLFFREERGQKTKVIARYMQYRAVEKIVERVKRNMKKEDEKNKGLIWHWQGSGKTLTMIFAANKLYHLKELENPTIFFILDRRDLEEQFYQEFNALDIEKVESIDSIRKLKAILKHDNGRGKRGFFTVLVHKFRPEELKNFKKELEELGKENKTILNRKNVVAFIDEGHRTQYGLLAAQMRDILQNAFFFAFTGTPISKKQRSTYEEFSYPPEEFYLDKYFITDSIEDGFTVQIAYQPRLEKDVHLKKDTLKILMEVEDEELPEEKKKEIQEKVKKRLNLKEVYYKNKERIEKIAKDIAEHFKENVDGKFKAMVVAGSREACVYYKKELDKHLPKDYSEVVMTYVEKEKSIKIREYLTKLQERYPNKEIREITKEIIENFKDEEKLPKILIVTEMLLTGFDAPILQTMYLDKPLKEHRLLQAIARTNRPYRGIKEAGVVIDYLGIIKEFKKAFEIYSKEEIEKAVIDKEEILNQFRELIKKTLRIFEDVKRDSSRESMLKALEILANEEIAKEFLKNYKELRKKFELLGSEKRKIIFFEEFKWLTYIYVVYLREKNQKEEFEDENYLKKYFSKTLKLIHKSTEIEDLKKNLPIINFDENYIKKLEEKFKTKEEKAANIVFTLNRYILVERQKDPIYESLVEKVWRLINLWREKTKDFEKIYREGLKIIEEKIELERRKKNLGLNNLEYSVLISLEQEVKNKEGLIKEVKKLNNILKKYLFSGWTNQVQIKKSIEREIRKFLIKNKKKFRIKLDSIDKISAKILDNLKKYGKKG